MKTVRSAPISVTILGAECAILGTMPELSRFHGIVISMFAERRERHRIAHFHVYYSGCNAIYAFDPVELLGGGLPRPQARLVEAWAELRAAELREAWKCLEADMLPNPIPPLS